MKEIDEVLARANALHERGEVLPLDLLVEAEQLGLIVSTLDQPIFTQKNETE